MRLVMVGLNHRTAPVEVRERVACDADAAAALIRELTATWPVAEALVLSTCNRTELYIVRPTHQPPSFADLVALLARRSGLDAAAMQGHCIHREQKEAVRHLFRVACGFDSMVIGEPQILGQVKRAYETSRAADAAGAVIHKVFQQAIAVAKRLRTETDIAAGRVSVGSAAVDFARRIFDHFEDKVILGIGAGEMAKLTLRHLHGLKPRRLWVCNRSLDRAAALVEHVGVAADAGGARPWEDLDQLLVEADIVVTSTGSAHPIVTAERFAPLIAPRRRRPIFLIDIALPRDIEARVGSLPNVYLYNIDDLRQVVDAAAQSRSDVAAACETLIHDAADRCMDELERRDIGVLIHKLRQQLTQVAEIEKQRTLRKLAPHMQGNGSAAAMEKTLDEHTHRLINKILHVPLSQLNHPQGPTTTAFYAAALRRLFDLEDAGDHPPHAASDERQLQVPGANADDEAAPPQS